MNDWLKKTVVLILIVAFIAPAAVLLVPQKTEAQGGACIGTLLTGVISLVIGTVATFLTIPVGDMVNKATHDINSTFSGGTFISDCIIKPMVKALVKQLIHQFLMSIVDWINDGFNGSGPRFVSDPASFFANIANQAIGQVVMGTDLNFLCSPFALDVRVALGLNYWSGGFRDRITCTLSDIINNTMSAADRTAYRNSWQSWLDLTTQPQNNPYGAYALAKSQIEINIANQQFVAKIETDWSSGFLSTKRCVEKKVIDPSEEEAYNISDISTDELLGVSTACTKYETVTPGKMIQEGISGTLQAEVSEYVAAEDIDAIFGALTNQMIGGIFKATGLFSGGRSKPNNYQKQFRDRVASGYYNPSGLPTSMTGESCDNIQNYISITRGNQQIVQFYNQVITPQHLQPTWDDTNISATDYEQAQNYCAQNPSWNAAQGAIDNITDQIEQGQVAALLTQQAQEEDAKIQLYSGVFVSQSCTEGDETANKAIDGSTMTFSDNCGKNQSWQLRFNQAEFLDEIRVFARDTSSDSLPDSIKLFDTDVLNNPFYTVTTDSTATQRLVLPPNARSAKTKVVYIPGGTRLREIEFYRHLKPIVNASKVPTTITAAQANDIDLILGLTMGAPWVTAVYFPTHEDKQPLRHEHISVSVKDSSNSAIMPKSNRNYDLPPGNYRLEYTATEPFLPRLTRQSITRPLRVRPESAQ